MGGWWWILWGWLIGIPIVAAFCTAWDMKIEKSEVPDFGTNFMIACFWPLLIICGIFYGIWKLLVLVFCKAISIVENAAKASNKFKKSNIT